MQSEWVRREERAWAPPPVQPPVAPVQSPDVPASAPPGNAAPPGPADATAACPPNVKSFADLFQSLPSARDLAYPKAADTERRAMDAAFAKVQRDAPDGGMEALPQRPRFAQHFSSEMGALRRASQTHPAARSGGKGAFGSGSDEARILLLDLNEKAKTTMKMLQALKDEQQRSGDRLGAVSKTLIALQQTARAPPRPSVHPDHESHASRMQAMEAKLSGLECAVDALGPALATKVEGVGASIAALCRGLAAAGLEGGRPATTAPCAAGCDAPLALAPPSVTVSDAEEEEEEEGIEPLDSGSESEAALSCDGEGGHGDEEDTMSSMVRRKMAKFFNGRREE